jgi:transcriptional regulator with XRE-family HTH domain
MQTIGERLEEARKKKGVSIREAAEATKIRGDYLQKFESNQFDIGLTEIYTRGFLRTYASFLKVPVDRIMSDYAALGRGDIRPRQPSREVYGRMDISVTTAGEAGERNAPPTDAPAAEPAAPSRPQPHYPRGTGSSLPSGPDPVVLFKWLKIGGAVVLVVVLVLVARAIFSGGSSTAKNQPAPSQPAPVAAAPQPAREPTITLVATNPMHVTVKRKNPDGTVGEVLFDQSMNRNETQTVAWPGPLYITSTLCEGLQLEVRGRRVGMGALTGYGTGQIPGPQ